MRAGRCKDTRFEDASKVPLPAAETACRYPSKRPYLQQAGLNSWGGFPLYSVEIDRVCQMETQVRAKFGDSPSLSFEDHLQPNVVFEIRPSDLDRFQESHWFNDTIVDWTISHFAARATVSELRKVCVQSSFLYTMMMERGAFDFKLVEKYNSRSRRSVSRYFQTPSPIPCERSAPLSGCCGRYSRAMSHIL
jgi:hypothetical protein